MFLHIKLKLAMYDDGMLTFDQLSGWLRFHVWAQEKR